MNRWTLSPAFRRSNREHRAAGRRRVIGTALRVTPGDASFANAVLSHGLVREDMHTGSVSHLGVVIFPAFLAFAHEKKVGGRDFIRAAIAGYETGAAVGRAVMDRDTVRRFRPTGVTGPLGAAIAGSLLLDLSEDGTTSALGLAANSTSGLNEWPASGADEMFFHAGFAARNAVTSVQLASVRSVRIRVGARRRGRLVCRTRQEGPNRRGEGFRGRPAARNSFGLSQACAGV